MQKPRTEQNLVVRSCAVLESDGIVRPSHASQIRSAATAVRRRCGRETVDHRDGR